jgi:ribosomal protein S18 acetylase RimI-like enzyme
VATVTSGAEIEVASVTEFNGTDLDDLCETTEAAIKAGGGFGWLEPPRRHLLESYWKGVLLVPDRHLIVARLDGAIAGSVQLLRPLRANEAQAHQAQLLALFVAPWARRRGLAKQLLLKAEDVGRIAGASIVNLDVRETQAPAIALFDAMGYQRWGIHPAYARVENQILRGLFYWKELRRMHRTGSQT